MSRLRYFLAGMGVFALCGWIPGPQGAATGGGSFTGDLAGNTLTDSSNGYVLTDQSIMLGATDVQVERTSEGILQVSNGTGTTVDGQVYLVSADEADGVYLSANGTAGDLEVGITAGALDGDVRADRYFSRANNYSFGGTNSIYAVESTSASYPLIFRCASTSYIGGLKSATEWLYYWDATTNDLFGPSTDDFDIRPYTTSYRVVLMEDNGLDSLSVETDGDVRVWWPNASPGNDYLELKHDGTNGRILTGAGSLELAPSNNEVLLDTKTLSLNGGTPVAWDPDEDDSYPARVIGGKKALTNNTATTLLQFALPNDGDFAGGHATVFVHATDGAGDYATIVYEFVWVAENDGGTVTGAADEVSVVGSTRTTGTWAAATGTLNVSGTNAQFQVTFNQTGFTPSAITARYVAEIMTEGTVSQP